MAERTPKSHDQVFPVEEFPKDPEKRFDAVFAAIGNSEAKCITLLCLSESPITAWDLNREFNKVVGGFWISNNSLQANYCRYALIPMGLVEEGEGADFSEGFRLTEAGRKFGQPIAMHLVKHSLEFPNSLSQMFAMTGSGVKKNRPIINGIHILEALSESKQVLRTRDIAQMTQIEDVHVGSHLRTFKKYGLVDYDFADLDRGGFSRYRILEEGEYTAGSILGGYAVLTRKVWEVLKERREVSIECVYDLLKDDYPRMSEKPLKSIISMILASMLRQGKCSKVNFGHETLSKAEITTLGQRVVSELILPAKNAFSGEGQFFESAREIDWRKYAPMAVLRHKESSRHINRTTIKDTKALIIKFVKEHPGARPKDIELVFGNGKGEYMRSLERNGWLFKYKKGRMVNYFTKSTNPSGTPGPIS